MWMSACQIYPSENAKLRHFIAEIYQMIHSYVKIIIMIRLVSDYHVTPLHIDSYLWLMYDMLSQIFRPSKKQHKIEVSKNMQNITPKVSMYLIMIMYVWSLTLFTVNK